MKKLFLIFAILLSLNANANSLNDIYAKYGYIHLNYKHFIKKERIIEGISAEGTQAEYYYDNNSLKLVKLDILGEMGKEAKEYYFDNDKVFLILIKETSYNAPMYAKEFNKNLSKTVTKELYFANKHLVKFIVNGKEAVKNSAFFKQEEKNSLHFVKILLHTAKR